MIQQLGVYTRDKRECDRIKAILLFADGWSIDMISQALLKHPSSIIRHLNDYIASKKITSDNGGSVSSLTSEQTKPLNTSVNTPIFICMKYARNSRYGGT